LLVGEDLGSNNYITKPVSEGGAGFATQWAVTFPHALRMALDDVNEAGRNINLVIEELGKNFNGQALQRVIYGDSHDSAANGSSRLSEEVSQGRPDTTQAREKSLIAAAIILTAPGVPMLLQGQEFMEGGSFNDWRELDWEKAEHYAGIVTAYKHLIALRRNHYGNSAGLTGNCINVFHVDSVNKVIAYHRWDRGGPGDDVLVIINFGDKAHDNYEIGLPVEGSWRVRFNSTWQGYSPDFADVAVPGFETTKNRATLVIPARSALILSQDKPEA
jgi:1,4-alpha-glucan branching enzyme